MKGLWRSFLRLIAPSRLNDRVLIGARWAAEQNRPVAYHSRIDGLLMPL